MYIVQNPYRVLGLPSTATQEEVVHTYRALLRRLHPDSPDHEPDGPQGGDRVQHVYEAYAILGDPRRRAEYDRHHELSQERASIFREPGRGAVASWVRRENLPPTVLGDVTIETTRPRWVAPVDSAFLSDPRGRLGRRVTP